MCLHGTYKKVNIINPRQGKEQVIVDACIAKEVQLLNDQGIITLGCCCGHGLAGQITKWENAFGKWKGHHELPHVLIDEKSVEDAKKLGYRPFPYYYANGEQNSVWQMYLKTGCVTRGDCLEWHKVNNVLYSEHVGVLAEKEESATPL